MYQICALYLFVLHLWQRKEKKYNMGDAKVTTGKNTFDDIILLSANVIDLYTKDGALEALTKYND